MKEIKKNKENEVPEVNIFVVVRYGISAVSTERGSITVEQNHNSPIIKITMRKNEKNKEKEIEKYQL